jgi:hypothetical protein
MRYLKYLIFGLVLSILPACATAQDSKITWSKGDKVAAFYICRTEEDIMEVALADSKGKHALRESVFKKNIARDCMNLNPPLGFIVTKIIGSYIDSNQNETTILAISIPSKTEI